MTCDTWHMTHSVGWTFSQNFRSLALPVWDWQCFEYISTNHHLNYYLINDEAVCRTAPATPGLLKIISNFNNYSAYPWLCPHVNLINTTLKPLKLHYILLQYYIIILSVQEYCPLLQYSGRVHWCQCYYPHSYQTLSMIYI